jgi:acyl carrier protein
MRHRMEELLEILSELHPEIDFKKEKNLIDDGILDSFDIITLVGELNDKFDVAIGVDDLTPENFNSAEAIDHLITYLKNET